MNQDRQNSQRRDAQNTEREQDFTTYRTAQSSNDMVPTVFRRGIYRTIRGSLKRFLSIVVITALGVSVMCGLKAGCEDLCDSVDAYFDQQNVYDINVQSTYGLTDDDLAAIQEVDGNIPDRQFDNVLLFRLGVLRPAQDVLDPRLQLQHVERLRQVIVRTVF